MSYIEYGSFKFGDIDMFETYGIQILDSSLAEDLLLPAVRPRKVTMPFRHGTYDYGAKYYNERPLTLNCVTLQHHSENQARSFAREIASALAKKDEIRLWNEPDRYYIGRIENEVTRAQHRDVGIVFTLEFTCDPFAYGETIVETFTNLQYNTHYAGTVPSPTKIVITNNSDITIKTIKITQLKKED